MPDSTQIETLQEQIRQKLAAENRESAVRACLAVLAPVPGDRARSYVDVLQRLQTVIAAEIVQYEGAQHA